MREFCLITGFFYLSIFSACAENKETNLNQYQWEKRIVLSYPSSSEAWEKQRQAIATLLPQIKDRDLLILRLDKPIESYDQNQRKNLIKKYELTKGSHVLIGKDGGIKGRQSGELDLDQWFKLIDTMPMRKNEMKR